VWQKFQIFWTREEAFMGRGLFSSNSAFGGDRPPGSKIGRLGRA
jgi:hypothetical protein